MLPVNSVMRLEVICVIVATTPKATVFVEVPEVVKVAIKFVSEPVESEVLSVK